MYKFSLWAELVLTETEQRTFTSLNKNAFQSKAHLPLVNRKWKQLQFDLGVTLTSFMTLTSHKLNQVKLMSRYQNKHFLRDDLDLDPMTLILKLDLDMVKMYHHTKNEVSMSTPSKVIAQTDRQTHTHTHTTKTLPLPHTREANIHESQSYQ